MKTGRWDSSFRSRIRVDGCRWTREFKEFAHFQPLKPSKQLHLALVSSQHAVWPASCELAAS